MKKKKEKTEKQKNKTVKRKVYEFFKIQKKSKASKKDETKKEIPKEKTVKVIGVEEQKVATKDQVKDQNKLLKNFLIALAIFTLVFVLIILAIYASRNFDYRGIQGDVIKEEGVIFYHISFPIILNEKPMNYNVYLRNDPRKLENIPFNGELHLLEMMVINSSDDVSCEGDGGIAIINLQQVLRVLGTNIIKDPNATCDSEGRYMLVNIKQGDSTLIEQTGPACYNLHVNDCEILKVTEKFLMEALIQKIGE